MQDQKATPGPDTATESPTAWFAVLERARLTEDFELAAKARAELERLGVKVRFLRRGRKAVRS